MLKTPQQRTEITTMQNPVLVSPQRYAGHPAEGSTTSAGYGMKKCLQKIYNMFVECSAEIA